jgi:hypothetical protein
MRTVTLALPKFAFVVGTRAALAAGVGMLVASRLSGNRRRTVGLGLIVLGAATTIPAARWLVRGLHASPAPPGVERDTRMVGTTRLARTGDEPL